MKKTTILKTLIRLVILGIVFIIGFFISQCSIAEKNQQIASIRTNKFHAGTSSESNEQSMEPAKNNQAIFSQKTDVINIDEELALLEKHVFGRWKFAEQIFDLQENNEPYYDVDQQRYYNQNSNLSKLGVDEMKKNITLVYSDYIVDSYLEIGQNSLSTAQDMYLYGLYGGFATSIRPVYRINKLENNQITLFDTHQVNPFKNIIDIRNMNINYEVLLEKGITRSVYIDPSDKEHIYVDFCGLWKMKRDDSNYGTGGKSPY